MDDHCLEHAQTDPETISEFSSAHQVCHSIIPIKVISNAAVSCISMHENSNSGFKSIRAYLRGQGFVAHNVL